ncbi:MAG TPA: YfiR family protein [Casimicrobiaceae bacterium]|nr:YfiR family protein [Casimicrobiaceae bacterium]
MAREWRFARAVRGLVFGLRACISMLACTGVFAQGSSVEYAVKATYLYKFAPFVEWPAGTFDSPNDPFMLCVVGHDPVAVLVDQAVQGQQVAGHVIDVLHLAQVRRDARCHILYVATHGPAAAAALDSVRGLPVLTVTDAAPDPRARGIVNFIVQDNRVRFEIDPREASENHLVISSKLLNLAVEPSPKP